MTEQSLILMLEQSIVLIYQQALMKVFAFPLTCFIFDGGQVMGHSLLRIVCFFDMELLYFMQTFHSGCFSEQGQNLVIDFLSDGDSINVFFFKLAFAVSDCLVGQFCDIFKFRSAFSPKIIIQQEQARISLLGGTYFGTEQASTVMFFKLVLILLLYSFVFEVEWDIGPSLGGFHGMNGKLVNFIGVDLMNRDGFVADDGETSLLYAFSFASLMKRSFIIVKIKLFAHYYFIIEQHRFKQFNNNRVSTRSLQYLKMLGYNIVQNRSYYIYSSEIQMELEEFKFIYDDMKAELKEIPSLPLLLKSIEKTTKKLDCINLYSQVDRREFDLQLFEKNIYEEMTQLYYQIEGLKEQADQSAFSMESLIAMEQKIEDIKQSKMQAFDKLYKLEESVQNQLNKLVDEQNIINPINVQNQIKEVEEDEDQVGQQQFPGNGNSLDRIQLLKREVDQLNKKISKINRGKGRWFDGDHADFVKIYTRCGGDAERLVEEAVKVLGMKNIEIMDHLEVYQNYLQLEKEKKLVNQEFKSIKMFEEEIKNQEELQAQLRKEEILKAKNRLKQQQQLIKKIQIQQFKRKKAEQREKLIRQLERQRQNDKKVLKISVDKKKQIQNRNKKIIQEKQEQYKIRNNSNSKINNNKSKPPPMPIIPVPTTSLKQINRVNKPPTPVKK